MLNWDARLTQRGVTFTPYQGQRGDVYWQLTDARFMDESEAQGRHVVFVEAVDLRGVRVVGARARLKNRPDQ